MRLLVLTLGLAGCASSASPAAAPAPAAAREGDDVIGKPAPPWQVSQWFNSPPLTMDGLRGKVVFVRWFTAPDCPFCSASAPALRELDEKYRARGLVVVGMYHHKREEPLDPADVAGWAKQYGYDFPVAIDDGWKTLNSYWLSGHTRDFTSVSFLVDRHGVIRRVHPGGTIDAKSQELRDIEADVEKLLAEP
jgi:thiol-disulfide isomerase/thioredoxin